MKQISRWYILDCSRNHRHPLSKYPGYLDEQVRFLFLAHHSQHAHAFAQMPDTPEASEWHCLLLFFLILSLEAPPLHCLLLALVCHAEIKDSCTFHSLDPFVCMPLFQTLEYLKPLILDSHSFTVGFFQFLFQMPDSHRGLPGLPHGLLHSQIFFSGLKRPYLCSGGF